MATIDIILPAFNPSTGWEEKVIDNFQFLKDTLPEFKFRLIIVNDGSTTILENQSLAILKPRIDDLVWIGYPVNRGKGYALRKGVIASDSDFIIYTDIDWPYSVKSMAGLIHPLIKKQMWLLASGMKVILCNYPPRDGLSRGYLEILMVHFSN